MDSNDDLPCVSEGVIEFYRGLRKGSDAAISDGMARECVQHMDNFDSFALQRSLGLLDAGRGYHLRHGEVE